MPASAGAGDLAAGERGDASSVASCRGELFFGWSDDAEHVSAFAERAGQ